MGVVEVEDCLESELAELAELADCLEPEPPLQGSTMRVSLLQ